MVFQYSFEGIASVIRSVSLEIIVKKVSWYVRNGILVKGGGEACQEASQLACVVFNKNGTLQQSSEPVFTDHEVMPGADGRLVRTMIKSLQDPTARDVVSLCELKETTSV